MSEEIQKDYLLDKTWKRYDLETLKEMLCEWLDWNMEDQFDRYPDIFI